MTQMGSRLVSAFPKERKRNNNLRKNDNSTLDWQGSVILPQDYISTVSTCAFLQCSTYLASLVSTTAI